MILQISTMDVKPGLEMELELGVGLAGPLYHRARGFIGLRLQRSVEMPSRYRLFVKWEAIEDHTVHFRESAAYAEWCELVEHCFAGPPQVEHSVEVVHLPTVAIPELSHAAAERFFIGSTPS
jgi:heme-degrading monooxygenase HmoA